MDKIVRGFKKVAPIVLIGLLFTVAACSDGEKVLPQKPSYDITQSSPSVSKFWADPPEVNVGEKTTVKWEATNANHVEISAITAKDGKAVDFKVSGSDTTGEKQTPALTEDTTFTIKVSKQVVENNGGGTKPKSTGTVTTPTSPDTMTFTVHVKNANAIRVDVSVDPASIFAGEQALLKWKVTPSTGMTVKVESNPAEAIAAVSNCEGSLDDIAARKAETTVPTEGCAVVAPTEKTEYTVTATASDGTVNTGKAQIAMKDSSEAKAQILINGQDAYAADSFDKPVNVTWTVEPASATVNITTDVPVKSCDPALYKLASNGSTSCQLTGDTVFTLTAFLSGKQVAQATARATLRGGNSVALNFGNTWAFAGEQVALNIAVVGGNAAAINSLSIGGQDLSADELGNLKKAKNIVKTITVGKSDMIATVQYGVGQSSQQTAIKVAPLNPVVINGTVSAAVLDGKLGNYIGVARDKFALVPDAKDSTKTAIDLSVFYYVNGVEKKAGIGKAIKSAAPTATDKFFSDVVKSFPVKLAINTTEDNKTELYLGTSGALLRSKDNGATWDAVGVWPLRADPKYGASHNTCGNDGSGKQKTLFGINNITDSQMLVSLIGVCDVIAKGNHVIVATDFGLKEKKDINSQDGWTGKPEVGKTGDETGLPTYGYVVNGIEEAGKYVYAATERGVYVGSTDEAVKMTKVGDIKDPVFAVAYDKVSSMLYIGKQDGLYKVAVGSDGKVADGTAFTKVDSVSKSVLSIKAGMDSILVGTTDGLYISRSSVENLKQLTSVSGPVPVLALGCSMANGANMDIAAIIGAGSNAFSSTIELPIPAL